MLGNFKLAGIIMTNNCKTLIRNFGGVFNRTRNSKTQKAGDDAKQTQIENMILNVGIDEKRVREIFQEVIVQVRVDYTEEALTIANSRIANFEESLLPKMVAADGALQAFADPSFQLLLVKAQKAAAATERPADYDLLSELLIHRFQKGDNRIARAGINRAVEIVDTISDDALLGLTVFNAVTKFIPGTADIYQGLDVLNELFGKLLCDGNLPTDKEWIEHLDILDAIRVNYSGKLNTFQNFYSEQLIGYIDVGIEKNSENHHKAIILLRTNNLPQEILIEHALNNHFLRVNLFGKNQINTCRLTQQENDTYKEVPLSEKQKNVLREIYDLYKQDENVKQANIQVFMQELDKRQNLKKIREWWDNIGTSINITSVGKVLAHSNAQRCDNRLPPLS